MTRKELLKDAYTISAGIIAININGSIIRGDSVHNLLENVNAFENDSFDHLIVEWIEALESDGADLCLAMSEAAENFKIDEERVDTAWIDYISA